MARLGVMFRPEWPPEELLDFAREVERGGLDELWVVEDCFLTGGLTMAASALTATSSLHVGIGLLPAAVRNAAITAMEIAGVARLHPGRLSVGFGHGVEAWMRQIGARPPDRLVVLDEVVSSVRALLRGETVSLDGRFVQLDDVSLDHEPTVPPPILIGTTGPRALAMSGRVADGFVLPEGSSAEAVRWACGQAGGGDATVYAWLSVDDDRDAAVEALRPDVERLLGMGLYPQLAARAGDGVPAIAVAGTPDDCVAAIRALWDAGADSVVAVPRHDDHAAQTRRFLADVAGVARS